MQALMGAFNAYGTFTILQKLYLPSILHLTLTLCNSLIFNALLCVGGIGNILH